MTRIILGIEYDGSGFCGWQWQTNQRSVQQVLEQALSRVANHKVTVQCAGRTDTGVHALEQVVPCVDLLVRVGLVLFGLLNGSPSAEQTTDGLVRPIPPDLG